MGLQPLLKVADLASHLAALSSKGVRVQPLLHLLLPQLLHSLLSHRKNCALLQACIQRLPISMPRQPDLMSRQALRWSIDHVG